ncbi:hypothetical protein HGRIS_014390 [Hohenbuehelia grisea]|uniref:Cell cycle control protein n=1 Tax=Hohenbuehelia grisea TaxID=104357 RepID=A0ABR3JU87_9AGAR
MALFKRAKHEKESKESDDRSAEADSSTKNPAPKAGNTAFKQQRLNAWQPIFSPNTVLPAFFIVALICGPIGGVLIWGASTLSEISLDYTECDNLAASSTSGALQFSDVPSSRYSYRLRAGDSDAQHDVVTPGYALLDNPSATDVQQLRECHIRFSIPATVPKPILFYYRLRNFNQNHRRYVKSFDTDQFRGKAISADELDKGSCHPVAKNSEGKAIYPCGLIANSIFNDTFSNLRLLNPNNETSNDTFTYELSAKGIAWPGERKKYTNTPAYDLADIVPPPNWIARFPNYTTENLPKLQDDEHFHNWMRTAALPRFPKLYGRNDSTDLQPGRYEIIVGLNFPVQRFKGTKEIVITSASWVGGKNPFLGWAYVGVSGFFFLVTIIGTIKHFVKPRRLGDQNLLSWNRPKTS